MPSVCFPDAQCENKPAAKSFRVVWLCMRMRFSPSGTISQCLMGQKMGVYTPREGTKLTPALQWQGHVCIVQLLIVLCKSETKHKKAVLVL